MKFNNTRTNSVKDPIKNPLLKLVGTTSGNAFALMGKAKEHNRKYNIYGLEDMNAIIDECMSDGYTHLLATLMHFFKVR